MAAVWLLDLEAAGRVWYVATEACEVPLADGSVRRYVEGLAEPGASWRSDSVSLELTIDHDWALAVAQGHALDRQLGTLRRWRPGTELERARVVARGLTTGAAYGARGEALSLSLSRDPRDLASTVPPPEASVTDETWPVTTTAAWPTTVPEDSLGASYPLVIGLPGYCGPSADPVCVVPVPVAQQCPGTGAASSRNRAVWLGGDATTVHLQAAHLEVPETAEVAVAQDRDLLGRRVQYVRLSDVGDATPDFRLGFAAAGGGGVKQGGELVRGAGQVITWVLRTWYTGPVDWGRLAAVAPLLDAWQIDTWIGEPSNAWDWLEDQVLPLLPVEVVEGSAGLYLALLRADLTEHDAVDHLDAGAGHVQRESPVTLTEDELANEVTVQYRPASGGWLGQVTLTARGLYASREGRRRNAGAAVDPDATTPTPDARIGGSRLAAESQRRYGVVPRTVAAAAVWDTATAGLVARTLLERHALPRRRVSYAGDADRLERLEPGACVLLTDPEVHLDAVVCRVVDVAPTADGAVVELEILDHPAVSTRAVA